jgi:hypothetical protein
MQGDVLHVADLTLDRALRVVSRTSSQGAPLVVVAVSRSASQRVQVVVVIALL